MYSLLVYVACLIQNVERRHDLQFQEACPTGIKTFSTRHVCVHYVSESIACCVSNYVDFNVFSNVEIMPPRKARRLFNGHGAVLGRWPPERGPTEIPVWFGPKAAGIPEGHNTTALKHHFALAEFWGWVPLEGPQVGNLQTNVPM